MKFETFHAGDWRQRYRYKSFEPVSVNREWIWEGRDVFRQILTLRTEVEQAVLGLGKRTPNARQVLNLLYRTPLISASDIEKGLHVSVPTANALIRDLTRLGILVETTGQQRWRTYAFDRYLALFVS